MRQNKGKLKLYYQNTRGLRTKLAQFLFASRTYDFDIVALTETWLNADIADSQLFTNNFTVHRHDRNQNLTDHTRGGGCLVAINKDISNYRIIEWENECPFENVWISLNKNQSNSKILINTVYIPPESSQTLYNSYYEHLIEKVNASEPNSTFIILGDFNLSGITWFPNGNYCEAYDFNNGTEANLIDTCNLTNLTQRNHIRNIQGRILDLVLSNITNLDITHCNDPFVNEDNYHPALDIDLDLTNVKFLRTVKATKLNFFKGNYEEIINELSQLDWAMVLGSTDININVQKFYETIKKSICKYVPEYPRTQDKYPKWYTNNVINLIKKKEFYRKHSSNSLGFKKLYEDKRREVKYEIRACLKRYQTNIENSISQNNKHFFAYTKAIKKSSNFPSVMKYQGNASDNPEVIANYFADYFEEVYTPTRDINIDEFFTCTCNRHFSITENDISNAITSLDKNKNNSPDKIPTIFYKNTISEIVKPLCILFNQSLAQKIFPTKWKHSLISPLFKAGIKSEIMNYRPISVLAACSKIFEKIIYFHLNNTAGNLICSQQHGFRAGKSTLTNLVEYTDFTTRNIVGGGQVDTIHKDLRKAFDKIDHKILIKRLHNLGISPCLLKWVYSYITNRIQIVCMNGVKSREIIPTSSVVQGTVLSPLLFALFVNDLPMLLNSKCLLLADDCKIFRKITSLQDCIALQKDVDTIAQWCQQTGLEINESKCAIITITRKPEDRTIFYNYRVNNINLTRCSVVTDLGVKFDNKLSFEAHINFITTRAYKMLGFILRSLMDFKSINTYKLLYNTYVRSLLEYNSQIWSPYYDKYIKQLEKVQNCFTRQLSYKFRFPRATPEERLIALNMHSLKHRRILADEMLLYKMFTGKVTTTLNDQINIHIPVRFTRFSPAFYIPNAASNIETYCTINRIQRQHNTHFMTVSLLNTSMSSFKSQISRTLSIP